jgi:hypothetical protein
MNVPRLTPARIGLGLALSVVCAFVISRTSCGPRVVVAPALDASAAVASSEPSSSKDAGGFDLPARCTKVTGEITLEGGQGLEVGDAEVDSGGALYLAASLDRESGRVGTVFRVSSAFEKAEPIDLGKYAGGDLAPRLFVAPSSLIVASYTKSESPRSFGNRAGTARVVGTRTLGFSRLSGATAKPLFEVLQAVDDSFGFDAVVTADGTGLVAWDEDSDRVVRGVVKVATFREDKLDAEPARVVTAYETDADSPKLVRTASGAIWLGYLAREVVAEPEGGAPDADLQGAYLEAPGEERAHQWIELVELDTGGKPKGQPFPITPRGKGFVSSFELVPREGGFDALIDDGAVRGDGLGARLERIAVRGGKAGLPEELIDGGMGAASPVVLGDSVSFVDIAERTMLLTLSPRVLTREPSARGGRFVATSKGSLYGVSLDVAETGPARAVLRRHSCL